MLKFSGEITDPIHKHIKLTDFEKELIDTPFFQRLRRIKQLAGAHLVYPSAQHSRFEHSVGSMHLAGLAGEHLLLDGTINSTETIQELRVASLLHDIGHGPFSHLFEEFLKTVKMENHEIIGSKIIRETEVADILNKYGYSPLEISKLSFGNSKIRYKNEIIAGSLSSDLMDYLPRDSFFTGAEYGKIDYNRIINSLKVIPGDRIALSDSALSSFESMLISRYQMFRAVYFHKTVRSVEVMLLNALIAAARIINFADFSLSEYLNLTDDEIIFKIRSVTSNEICLSKQLINNYLNRVLLKCVYEKFIQKKENHHFVRDRKRLGIIKDRISDISGVKEDDVFLDTAGISSVPLAPNKKEMKSLLLVSDEEAIKKSMSDIPLVNSISGYLDMIRVYATAKCRDVVKVTSKKVLEDEDLINVI